MTITHGCNVRKETYQGLLRIVTDGNRAPDPLITMTRYHSFVRFSTRSLALFSQWAIYDDSFRCDFLSSMVNGDFTLALYFQWTMYDLFFTLVLFS